MTGSPMLGVFVISMGEQWNLAKVHVITESDRVQRWGSLPKGMSLVTCVQAKFTDFQ